MQFWISASPVDAYKFTKCMQTTCRAETSSLGSFEIDTLHTAHNHPKANDVKVYLPSLLRVRGIRKMYAQNLHTIQSVNILIA